MLELYNTLTRKTEPFQPAEDKQVKMYTCGPSTYQQAHIGNYRTFLFEDKMNNDLDMQSAFDNLNGTIGEIHERRPSLGAGDLKNVLDGLRRIDSVLQCIF